MERFHFLALGRAAGKTAQYEPNFKIGRNPPKSGKRTKHTCNPPYWRDIGIQKWSPSFGFSTLKTGTFGKKNEGVSTSWAKLFNSCFMSLLFMTMLIVMIHRILFVVVPRFWEIVESYLALSE